MTLRLCREIFGKCWKHARCRLVQQDLRVARIDVTKVMRQRHPRHLRERARHFHADCARTDQHEGEQLPYCLGIGVIESSHLLGTLECKQDLAANQVRVIQGFEPGCHVPPLVVSEVVVSNAGGKDQVVVRD